MGVILSILQSFKSLRVPFILFLEPSMRPLGRTSRPVVYVQCKGECARICTVYMYMRICKMYCQRYVHSSFAGVCVCVRVFNIACVNALHGLNNRSFSTFLSCLDM